MDWYNVKNKTPEPFVSVLCYIPSEKPLPTVHEGFIDENGEWHLHLFYIEAAVTHWAQMPEYPE